MIDARGDRVMVLYRGSWPLYMDRGVVVAFYQTRVEVQFDQVVGAQRGDPKHLRRLP